MPARLAAAVLLFAAPVAFAASHPPLRQNPPPSERPAATGPGFYVHPTRGDDTAAGDKAAPWRTVAYAAKQLKPGDTLYLHGGVYYERLYLALAGRADAPITVRSVPGEQAVIDGGWREFAEAPAGAWEPAGGNGEFRSKRRYANVRDVVGSFADSMVGLQTYYHAKDLRATGELVDWEDWARTDATDLKPLYCGPGVWLDRETGRVHCRLAHTHLPAPVPNYRGETDPRKQPLVLAPFDSVPLHLDGAKHVRVQDLVIRGAGYTTIHLDHAEHVELDNLTVWCGTYGIRAAQTGPLKVTTSRFYGSLAPWTFRSDASKRDYPGRPHRNISRLNTHALLELDAGRESSVFAFPQNDHWEIGYCEFADAHDGVYLGAVNVKFHHNRLDNLQDDGIYLSPMYLRHRLDKNDPQIHVYQNHFGAMLTALAFGGSEPVTADKVFVYRNVFDLRGPIQTGRPSAKKADAGISTGKVIGDHGSPPWSAMTIYHNTFVGGTNRDAAMATFAASKAGHPRRVYNNVFAHAGKLPAFPPPDPANTVVDGNLYWAAGSEKAGDAFFKKFRGSELFAKSKDLYAPGSTANCRVADPGFTAFAWDATAANDYRPRADSAAKAAGVVLPADWPDPHRPADGARPDAGALPVGATAWRVGPTAPPGR